MIELGFSTTTWKTAEIMVLGGSDVDKHRFIEAFCPTITASDKDFTFGQLEISDNFDLFVYGMNLSGQFNQFAWDLVARKIMGTIILFNWNSGSSFQAAKEIITFLGQFYHFPIICAANVGDRPYPVAESFFRPGIGFGNHHKFLFYKDHNSASIKRTIVSLIDLLLVQQ